MQCVLFVEAASTGVPAWVGIVLGLVGTVVAAFMVPWLRAQAAKARAEASRAGIEAGATLFERVKEFVFRRVADLMADEYPKIAAEVLAGKLTKDTIKTRLQALGARLRQEAVAHFAVQNLDLVGAIGDDALDKLIRSAANQLSPFPGRDTAVAFLEAGVSDTLVKKGVEWARAKFTPPDAGPAADV